MTSPKLTVSIVAFNSDDVLGDCLRSIQTAAGAGLARVVVIDNASPDASVETARSFSFVETVVSERNLGFAGGHNLCWPGIDTEYWLILNPDATITREQIEDLLRWMDENPRVALASPALVRENGESYHSERKFPSILRTFVSLFRLHLFMSASTRASFFAGPFADKTRDSSDADWVPGTAVIARCAAVREVGVMSEDFHMYGEDVEWCWRFRKSGWRIGVVNSVTVTHRGSTSADRTFDLTDKETRVERATYKVVRRMKGGLYAKALVALELTSAVTEAVHPRRSTEHRARMRRTARKLSNLLFNP